MNNHANNVGGSGAAAHTAGQPLSGHRSALTLLMMAYALSMCDRMILSILFPEIKAEITLSDTQLGLLGGVSFAFFYATMGLPIARLFGISGAIGALLAGKVFDRLAARGFQYGMWMLAIVPFLTMPLFIMGLGPLLIGVLSDLLTPRYGADALGLALTCFTLVGLWAALHSWLCGRVLAKQKAQSA